MNILHWAATYGRDIEVFEWILENNIIDDINDVDVNGWTCLHCWMEYIYKYSRKTHRMELLNERQITKLLVSHGIDPTIKANNGSIAKELLHEMQDEFYNWLVD